MESVQLYTFYFNKHPLKLLLVNYVKIDIMEIQMKKYNGGEEYE